MKYTFIKDYKNQEKFRRSFCEMAKRMFGINIGKWYDKGLWGEKYIPYSLVDGDKVIANVSVNLMEFEMDGVMKKYIQLGTVMTEKAYRGQGCLRYLMEMILEEYKGQVDGFYLFANDSVLEFYPKFGFVKSKEYQYSKVISGEHRATGSDKVNKIVAVDMGKKENLDKLLEIVGKGKLQYRFQMKNNPELIGFYAMDEYIYQIEDRDTYVFAEVKGDKLIIQDIISEEEVNLDEVIAAFGNEIKKVELGFTPYDKGTYMIEELHEEDTTLFIIGEDLKQIADKKLCFPALSHA